MAIGSFGKVLGKILLHTLSVVGQSPSSWGPDQSFNQGLLDLQIGSGLDPLQGIVSFIAVATLSLPIIHPSFLSSC